MMKRIRRHTRLSCRGFTLTELAIVLLVVGFIVGAIWVAGQNTWDAYRVYRANQQMGRVTQNIREYYMSAITLPASGTTPCGQPITSNNLTPLFDCLGLFPLEMRRTPGAVPGTSFIDNPFNVSAANGSFQVVGGLTCSGTTASPCFRIRMLGLTQETCIKLLAYVPVDNQDLGIVQAGAQAGTNPSMASGTTTLTAPISPSTAEGWCNAPGGVNNEADWDFKLRN